MVPTNASIRESILSSKGLRLDKGKITNRALLPVDKTGNKTNYMLYVESLHKKPIEHLIWSAGKYEVAERLEVPVRTISRWRVKFPRKTKVA